MKRLLSAAVLIVLAGACSSDPSIVDNPIAEDVPKNGSYSFSEGWPDGIAPDGWGTECEEGAGCFGSPCTSAEDCPPGGACVEHQGERVCTVPCDGLCPPGWVCEPFGRTSLCVSQYPMLCRPCTTAADCQSALGVGVPCLEYGQQGSFCGGDCAESGECPSGYGCKSQVVNGEVLKQCVAQSGVCSCSETSTTLGLSTPCSRVNEWGICTGEFTCAVGGTGACDAQQPAQEVCNSADDNCDGQVDEGVCGDPDPCAGSQCTNGDTMVEPCGQCGTRTCVCTPQCLWGACGECLGEGECAAGAIDDQTDSCNGCGTRTRSRACGDGCQWGGWSDWSACQGGGECGPGETQSESSGCGSCGTKTRSRTCGDGCAWGAWGSWSSCAGQGVCAVGKTQSESQGCGNCGSKSRSRTCNGQCAWGSWGSWSSCSGQGACAPGQTQAGGCDECAQKVCNNQCKWGGCALKPGAECEWQEGSHWKCCGGGKWHFCLPPKYGCVWSSQCIACSGCGC